MQRFAIVSAAEPESAVFESLHGRLVNQLLGFVYWSGTIQDLYRYLRPLIPRLILIAPLDDCMIGQV
jgi:hypothetical protein